LQKLSNPKPILGLSLLFLGVLITLNLIGTNALATQGFAVSDLEMKIIALEKENKSLKTRIEEKTNFNIHQQIASEKGYFSARDIVFMPTSPATALR